MDRADHNEAVELWNQVPESERPSGTVVSDWNPKETQRAEGVLKNVVCGEKEKTALSSAHPATSTIIFAPEGRFLWGFSDTLWLGETT